MSARFENAPKKGISVAEDLGGTTLVLTRQRGGDKAAGFVALLLMLPVILLDPGIFLLAGGPLAGLVGVLFNQVEAQIRLTATAIHIQHVRFRRHGASHVVPYATITRLERRDRWFGASTLTLHRVQGAPVEIPLGEPADHEALMLEIDKRRPIARLPHPDALEPPAALKQMIEE